METRHVDWVTIRATLIRLTILGAVVLPLLLAACQPSNGGGAPGY